VKKYGRWILFGLVAVGIIVLLILGGVNKDLRQRLTALLLERKVKNKIQDLKEEAAASRAKAEASEISAEEAEQVATATEEAISEQKKALEMGLEERGLNADEIADRFGRLGV
jgi:DNA-directed RNA polymerase specialized sigma24 family protein